MNEVQKIIKDAARMGADLALASVGKIPDEVSRREAIKLYGQPFVDLVKRGKLEPVRVGNGNNGKHYYNRHDINAALAAETVERVLN